MPELNTEARTEAELFLISRDLKAAASTLTDREARYLVDAYYQMQEDRIRNAHQVRAAAAADEPHAVLTRFQAITGNIETSIKGALHNYAKSKPLGRWCLSIHGIGPVVTAGLLAHIDIEQAPTVGHIWRFAGLDPSAEWLGREKASKLVKEVLGTERVPSPAHIQELVRRGPFKEATLRRFATNDSGDITAATLSAALARQPWNAKLKRLCWIIGGLFVRLRNSDKDVYGKVYERRKAYEQEKNERGDYAETARRTLLERKITDTATRKTYESGRLPDGRIDLRARRYATKLFLSAFHEVAYFLRYDRLPPKPYVLEHIAGHVHYIEPPKIDQIPGWREARRAQGL